MRTTNEKIGDVDRAIADLQKVREGLVHEVAVDSREAKDIKRRELQGEYVNRKVRIRASFQGRTSGGGVDEHNILAAVVGQVLDVWDGYERWWAKVRVPTFGGGDMTAVVRLERVELVGKAASFVPKAGKVKPW